MKRHRWTGWAMLTPAVLWFLILGIFPLVYSLWLSFHSMNLLDPSRGINPVGFKNYVQILVGRPRIGITFVRSLRITFTILAGSLALELLLGLSLAVLVSRMRASGWLRAMRSSLMVPMLIAPAVVGMMFRFLFEPSYGFVNYVLSFFGVDPIYWISDPKVVIWSVILVSVWEWLPFAFLVFLAGLNSIPQEQMEAAAVDGAGFMQQLWYIMLPWLRRLIGVLILLRGLDLIRNFDVIYTLSYGGPGVTSSTVSFNAYLTGLKYFEMGEGAAYAFLIVILINILVIIFLRFLVPAREESYAE
jgi:multiple sugar transport system permease protein